MSNIQKYIYSVVYPFFISKYLFKNIHEMPILKSINLEVIVKNISSETDLRILEIFSFLEQISGQRPYIKKFTSTYQQKRRHYFLILGVTLRNLNLFYFLEYFLMLLISQKFLIKFHSSSSSFFSFVINDFEFFSGLKETLKSLPVILKINFNFKTNNNQEALNTELSKNFLSCLGFNEVFKRKR